ncbi:hypothetical protein Xmau_03824 [Xenorhabdus mauleonii]|uniref:Uncharacterized protein n=1 Tax=Xenorhabdus mauleonii TaxID=351675 RepID=A0A1I3V3B1_9GAMM|nr:hypothetical protein Xmau_03824 [Xenorhabdus mauleonii]SFJ89590.1 hypothetical protein SAMN05421680_11928 [Xenorhabdus mauleonii]
MNLDIKVKIQNKYLLLNFFSIACFIGLHWLVKQRFDVFSGKFRLLRFIFTLILLL